jgi:hypothetical protein
MSDKVEISQYFTQLNTICKDNNTDDIYILIPKINNLIYDSFIVNTDVTDILAETDFNNIKEIIIKYLQPLLKLCKTNIDKISKIINIMEIVEYLDKIEKILNTIISIVEWIGNYEYKDIELFTDNFNMLVHKKEVFLRKYKEFAKYICSITDNNIYKSGFTIVLLNNLLLILDAIFKTPENVIYEKIKLYSLLNNDDTDQGKKQYVFDKLNNIIIYEDCFIDDNYNIIYKPHTTLDNLNIFTNSFISALSRKILNNTFIMH